MALTMVMSWPNDFISLTRSPTLHRIKIRPSFSQTNLIFSLKSRIRFIRAGVGLVRLDRSLSGDAASLPVESVYKWP